jgi:signal recognition particle subunit SRP54
MSELSKNANMGEGDVEKQMGQMRAIYDSMTKVERKNTDVLDGNRRRRIARGAGVDVSEVGQFVKQFEMSRDMMRAVGGMGMMGKLKLMKALSSGGLQNLGMPGGPMLKTKRSGWQAPKERNKKKRR